MSSLSIASSTQSWKRAFLLLCAFQIVVWTAMPTLLRLNVSLDVAEIVSWGHEWQLGYYKHPPLVSWISEAARVLSGNQATFFIYVAGQLAIVLTFFAIWRLALLLKLREKDKKPRAPAPERIPPFTFAPCASKMVFCSRASAPGLRDWPCMMKRSARRTC